MSSVVKLSNAADNFAGLVPIREKFQKLKKCQNITQNCLKPTLKMYLHRQPSDRQLTTPLVKFRLKWNKLKQQKQIDKP